MKSHKKVLAAAAVAVGIGAVAAGPAQANFYAYDHSNFRGVIANIAGNPSYIDVADDRTSSIKNHTKSDYSGRSTTVAYGSHQVFYAVKNSSYSHLGAANDKIDHFDRR